MCLLVNIKYMYVINNFNKECFWIATFIKRILKRKYLSVGGGAGGGDFWDTC